MKKKFAFLTLVFAVVCCLGISGCSDNKSSSASNSQPANSVEKPSVTTDKAAEQPKVVAKEEASMPKPEQPVNMASPTEENKSMSVTTVASSGPKFRDDFMDENFSLPTYEVTAEAPGANTVFERSFENAPPLIPHNLDGLLPITTDNNMCLSCHAPEAAEPMQIKSYPKSHMADLRDENQRSLEGALSMSRYDCVACHVVQTNATQLVKNNFEADFRYEDSNTSSNLLDILNQGANVR